MASYCNCFQILVAHDRAHTAPAGSTACFLMHNRCNSDQVFSCNTYVCNLGVLISQILSNGPVCLTSVHPPVSTSILDLDVFVIYPQIDRSSSSSREDNAI